MTSLGRAIEGEKKKGKKEKQKREMGDYLEFFL